MKKQCYIENRRQDHADEAIRHGQSKAHRPPTTNHFIIGSSPDPAGGGPYEGTQARENPQEGVGRNQMMGDIFNRLVLRLMDEQVSKTRRRVIIPCVSFLVSCLFVSPVRLVVIA